MWSMKHTSTFTVSLFFLFAEAVYFSHRKPELCLHVPAGSGTTVGRMYAYLNKKDWCGIQQDKSDVIAYYIIGEHDLFTINSSGWIFLKTSVTENLVGPVSFDVSASCTPTSDTVITATTQVTVTFHSAADTQLVTDQINPNISDSTIDHVCFSHISDDSSFAVEENTKDVVIGRLNTCWQDRKYDRTYKVEKPKSRFNIDPETSEVKLIKQLDRESLGDDKGLPNNISGVQPLKIICEMKIDGVIRTSERHRINISVLDVNDNPPRFHYHNGSQHITKDVEIQTDTAQQSIDDIEEVVEDIDASNSNNTHELRVLTDPLNVCKPNLHCPLSPKLANTVCRFRIHLQNLDIISANLYRCEVAVIDTEFVKPDDTLMNNSATIVVNIHKPVSGAQRAMSLKSTLTLNFYRNATRLGRLYTFNEDMRTNTRYTLTDIVFSITPRLGIVYVDNTDAIPAAPDRYSMSVGQSDGPDIMIDIVLHGTRRQADYCEEGCSGHDSTRSCTGACGLGLTSGGCIMRGSERNTGMSKYYGTCTPDVATCPDLTCDELEDTFPLLCPQDCTTEVIGAYLPNKNYNPPRGIGMAVSPCWCEEDYEIVCTCMSVLHENFTITDKDVDSPAPSPLDRTKLSSKVSTDGSVGYSVEKKAYGSDKLHPGVDQTSRQLENGTHQTDTIALVTEQPPICDQVCGVAIGFGLTVFLLITFSLFMLWFTKRKNDRRKTNMKHVGSVVSISALPSDYQDDRERRPSYSSDHWSQKGLIYSTTQMQCIHDDNGRWEVPREMLTLEKTIGEGEFGLVVKAKMAVMDGDQKKNVAIKMLKHCSTQIEEQDLWSEYNLLKDLCHPNVIRLIGACTTDGPFYLVVEFCRHGCLLKYLRRSRLEENGYINSGMRFKSPNVKEQTDPELMGDLLTMRDLLSFSWQIAKGMSYLSEIKLVHRDLAARNILVASNRVLKISDFGLTRDVYEADTYMKKSKGRIPVKWLAPESLYAQIYTTRSDIWSYGIVLWEIVTLGAPPYPGIPPERLYNLLIGGYRMDRPENCLDEMYAVMQKCWKIDATDRPSFAALAIIFDRILQEKTGYLDLSQTIVNTSNMYNKCFTSKCNENEQEDNLSSQYDEISHNSGSEDSIDKMNIFTVCNETYHTDDYLTPTPANKQPRHSDNVLPLLETRKRGREENVKTDQISQEVGISAKKFNLDDHLHEISLNDMARSDGHIRGVVLNEDTTNSEQSLDHGVTDSNSRDNEHSHIMPNITAQGPMLKKKSENSLPTIRYTKNIKNKHVIYPSEHVALLTDGGNAMCVKESDYVEQETSQC